MRIGASDQIIRCLVGSKLNELSVDRNTHPWFHQRGYMWICYIFAQFFGQHALRSIWMGVVKFGQQKFQ